MKNYEDRAPMCPKCGSTDARVLRARPFQDARSVYSPSGEYLHDEILAEGETLILRCRRCDTEYVLGRVRYPTEEEEGERD